MIDWLLWLVGIRTRLSRKELLAQLERNENYYAQEMARVQQANNSQVEQLISTHERHANLLRKAALEVHSASAGTDGYKLATMKESFYAVQKDNRALTDRVAKLKAANKKLRLHLKVIQ